MSFRFRDNIERMAGYVPGFQPTDAGAVKINTNENPYPPAKGVFEALAGLTDLQLRRYPPIEWDAFRKTAARVHGIDEKMVVCGNGGDELLTMLVRLCCDRKRGLAYPVPTYTLYPVLAEIQDCPVYEVPFADDYAIPAGLAKTGAALTILCNPNAPTCSYIEPAAIEELAKAVAGVLLIDEAYADFAPGNCQELLGRYENVAILRSMSKGYSLAGMRFGYLLASERIVAGLMKVKDSYNVNIAAQAAATAALADQEYFRGNVKKIIAQRERLVKALRGYGFATRDSHTNFVLTTVGPRAKEIYDGLCERGIYVRYWSTGEMADKLRISVGSAAEMDKLLAVLEEVV